MNTNPVVGTKSDPSQVATAAGQSAYTSTGWAGTFGKAGETSDAWYYAGGGGGWYGGTTLNAVGSGGGSGHVSSALTSAVTTAGNQSFPSVSGGTETGHTGAGYAKITMVEAY